MSEENTEVMPGADPMEPQETLDLNFGLGEEDIENIFDLIGDEDV